MAHPAARRAAHAPILGLQPWAELDRGEGGIAGDPEIGDGVIEGGSPEIGEGGMEQAGYKGKEIK